MSKIAIRSQDYINLLDTKYSCYLMEEENEINTLINLFYNSESELGRAIIDKQVQYASAVKANELLYGKNIIAYKTFIQLATKVIKEIGLPNNEISYSLVISRLIHDGFISENLFFFLTENKNKVFDISGYLGIDIVNGYGCCRHVSGIHRDLFNDMELFNDDLPCTSVPTYVSLKQAIEMPANHSVNLLKYNGLYYIHDALNKKFYTFNNGITMKQYPNNVEIMPKKLFYKPEYDIIINNTTFSEVKEKIKDYSYDSMKSHISVSELRDIMDETNLQYDRNKDVLGDFVQEARLYIRRIVPKNYIYHLD